MHFKIGEKVVFLREAGGGIVTKIEGFTIYVEDETGFDRPFKANDLGKIHGTDYTVPKDDSTLRQLADGTTTKSDKNKHPQAYTVCKGYWEIDLHFEDLVDVYGEKIRNHQEQALLKQLAVFKEVYYKARGRKIRKLIVIHGYGKGILRDEVKLFLKGQEGVDFWDAPYVEYGHGAIQVEIKYRN